jgi:hypothetical protein
LWKSSPTGEQETALTWSISFRDFSLLFFPLECFKLLELDRECGKSLELSNSSPTPRLTAEVYKTLFLRDADAGQVLDIRSRKIVIFKLMAELNHAENVAPVGLNMFCFNSVIAIGFPITDPLLR